MKKIIASTLTILLLSSCAQVVSTNSTINDLVMMSVKTNSKVGISYSFNSD